MTDTPDKKVTQIAKDLLARPTTSWAYALSNFAAREPTTPGWTSEQVLNDLQALGLLHPSGWYAEVTALGQKVAAAVRILAPVRWEVVQVFRGKCELCGKLEKERRELRAATDIEPRTRLSEHTICLNCLGELVANACEKASEDAGTDFCAELDGKP